MLRHMKWFEVADLIVKGMEGTIANTTLTYDFERLMDGAKLLTRNVYFWHKADISIKKLMAPSGSSALPGCQPHCANRLCR